MNFKTNSVIKRTLTFVLAFAMVATSLYVAPVANAEEINENEEIVLNESSVEEIIGEGEAEEADGWIDPADTECKDFSITLPASVTIPRKGVWGNATTDNSLCKALQDVKVTDTKNHTIAGGTVLLKDEVDASPTFTRIADTDLTAYVVYPIAITTAEGKKTYSAANLAAIPEGTSAGTITFRADQFTRATKNGSFTATKLWTTADVNVTTTKVGGEYKIDPALGTIEVAEKTGLALTDIQGAIAKQLKVVTSSKTRLQTWDGDNGEYKTIGSPDEKISSTAGEATGTAYVTATKLSKGEKDLSGAEIAALTAGNDTYTATYTVVDGGDAGTKITETATIKIVPSDYKLQIKSGSENMTFTGDNAIGWNTDGATTRAAVMEAIASKLGEGTGDAATLKYWKPANNGAEPPVAAAWTKVITVEGKDENTSDLEGANVKIATNSIKKVIDEGIKDDDLTAGRGYSAEYTVEYYNGTSGKVNGSAVTGTVVFDIKESGAYITVDDLKVAKGTALGDVKTAVEEKIKLSKDGTAAPATITDKVVWSADDLGSGDFGGGKQAFVITAPNDPGSAFATSSLAQSEVAITITEYCWNEGASAEGGAEPKDGGIVCSATMTFTVQDAANTSAVHVKGAGDTAAITVAANADLDAMHKVIADNIEVGETSATDGTWTKTSYPVVWDEKNASPTGNAFCYVLSAKISGAELSAASDLSSAASLTITATKMKAKTDKSGWGALDTPVTAEVTNKSNVTIKKTTKNIGDPELTLVSSPAITIARSASGDKTALNTAAAALIKDFKVVDATGAGQEVDASTLKWDITKAAEGDYVAEVVVGTTTKVAVSTAKILTGTANNATLAVYQVEIKDGKPAKSTDVKCETATFQLAITAREGDLYIDRPVAITAAANTALTDGTATSEATKSIDMLIAEKLAADDTLKRVDSTLISPASVTDVAAAAPSDNSKPIYLVKNVAITGVDGAATKAGVYEVTYDVIGYLKDGTTPLHEEVSGTATLTVGKAATLAITGGPSATNVYDGYDWLKTYTAPATEGGEPTSAALDFAVTATVDSGSLTATRSGDTSNTIFNFPLSTDTGETKSGVITIKLYKGAKAEGASEVTYSETPESTFEAKEPGYYKLVAEMTENGEYTATCEGVPFVVNKATIASPTNYFDFAFKDASTNGGLKYEPGENGAAGKFVYNQAPLTQGNINVTVSTAGETAIKAITTTRSSLAASGAYKDEVRGLANKFVIDTNATNTTMSTTSPVGAKNDYKVAVQIKDDPHFNNISLSASSVKVEPAKITAGDVFAVNGEKAVAITAASGETKAKTATITIFDDGVVDKDKTVKFGITINGITEAFELGTIEDTGKGNNESAFAALPTVDTDKTVLKYKRVKPVDGKTYGAATLTAEAKLANYDVVVMDVAFSVAKDISDAKAKELVKGILKGDTIKVTPVPANLATDKKNIELGYLGRAFKFSDFKPDWEEEIKGSVTKVTEGGIYKMSGSAIAGVSARPQEQGDYALMYIIDFKKPADSTSKIEDGSYFCMVPFKIVAQPTLTSTSQYAISADYVGEADGTVKDAAKVRTYLLGADGKGTELKKAIAKTIYGTEGISLGKVDLDKEFRISSLNVVLPAAGVKAYTAAASTGAPLTTAADQCDVNLGKVGFNKIYTDQPYFEVVAISENLKQYNTYRFGFDVLPKTQTITSDDGVQDLRSTVRFIVDDRVEALMKVTNGRRITEMPKLGTTATILGWTANGQTFDVENDVVNGDMDLVAIVSTTNVPDEDTNKINGVTYTLNAIPDYTYTGKKITPVVIVKAENPDGSTRVIPAKELAVTYKLSTAAKGGKNAQKVGEYTAEVLVKETGKKVTAPDATVLHTKFKVNPVDVSDFPWNYTGFLSKKREYNFKQLSNIKLNGVKYRLGVDYTYTVEDPDDDSKEIAYASTADKTKAIYKNADQYTFTIKGLNEGTGEAALTGEVTNGTINVWDVSYTANQVSKLGAKLVVAGANGKYKSLSKMELDSNSEAHPMVQVKFGKVTYEYNEATGWTNADLNDCINVEYVNCNAEGKGTVVISGDDVNYFGSVSKQFTIKAPKAKTLKGGKALKSLIPSNKVAKFYFKNDGYTLEQVITAGGKTSADLAAALGITEAGLDIISISYSNNVKAGTATATITAKPGTGWGGSQKLTWKILKPSVAKLGTAAGANVEIISSAVKKAAKGYTCDLSLGEGNKYADSNIKELLQNAFSGDNLVLGRDFTITYGKPSSKNVMKVTVKGIGGYQGSVSWNVTTTPAEAPAAK